MWGLPAPLFWPLFCLGATLPSPTHVPSPWFMFESNRQPLRLCQSWEESHNSLNIHMTDPWGVPLMPLRCISVGRACPAASILHHRLEKEAMAARFRVESPEVTPQAWI